MKSWSTSRARSALVNVTSAIFLTGMPCADGSTIVYPFCHPGSLATPY
ncbi:hypothetical protein [Actinomadura sp. NTSP31]